MPASENTLTNVHHAGVSLPEDFVQSTRELMGDERFNHYLAAFSEEPPVSIRLNPLKSATIHPQPSHHPVPWCPLGLYLTTRPNFTFDPLLHAGCYYVQEAASMFIHHILTTASIVSPHTPLKMLDLCAAPGGKSTCAISALPKGSLLWTNEPDHRRASILLENITKWGYDGCTVTNSYPRDYREAKIRFDIILCDVPCSGEGMFRRDPQTISEWSTKNVERCWRLQRDIVSDAWQCLQPGGLLIYSTCTFNTKENEENVRWILETFDADIIDVPTQPGWGITGSLMPGFNVPVYRFIPGITRTEGLFVAVMRKKTGQVTHVRPNPAALRQINANVAQQDSASRKGTATNGPQASASKQIIPLSYPQAIAYLRGEALVLPPDAPRGIINVGFMGHTIGQVKNLGTRANNLYPKEWRIKSSHMPQVYESILCLNES
ncbi:MAG: hypothetical protein K6G08_03120 [Prevotella sp.]|nr:hypothetical protein [Prevotella sp.]